MPSHVFTFSPIQFTDDDGTDYASWRLILEQVCREFDLTLDDLTVFEHQFGAIDGAQDSDEFADGLVAWSPQHVFYCESYQYTSTGDNIVRVVHRDPPSDDDADFGLHEDGDSEMRIFYLDNDERRIG